MVKTKQDEFMDNFFANGGVNSGGTESPFFKIQKDDKGIGAVVFRLMPMSEANEKPFLQYWKHDIKLGDKYLKALCEVKNHEGKSCPFCDIKGEIWEKHGGDIGKKFYPKQKFMVNIYIVNDPSDPSNNGKIFPFVISNGSNPKSGKGLFTDILNMIQGSSVKKGINMFSLKDGADLIYTIDFNTPVPSHTIEKDDKVDRSKEITKKMIETQPLFSDIEPLEVLKDLDYEKYEDKIRSYYKMYTKSQGEKIDDKTDHTSSTSELDNPTESNEEEPIPDNIEDLLK